MLNECSSTAVCCTNFIESLNIPAIRIFIIHTVQSIYESIKKAHCFEVLQI